MALEVLSIKATRMQDKFDLYNEIRKLVKKNNVSLQNGDILVIFGDIIFDELVLIISVVVKLLNEM